MLFSKKNRQKPQKPGQGNHNANSLYPVLYVTEHLKDYKDDLIQKEVDSLFELSLVNNSFRRFKESGRFPNTAFRLWGILYKYQPDSGTIFRSQRINCKHGF